MVVPGFTTVAFVHGAYYLVAGVWPLFHISSFLWVTGPKTDLWLVHTVGVLVAVIGAVLISAARRQAVTFEIRLLALGSALGLTGIEAIYVSLDRIAPIYLLDAALEVGLIAWWLLAWEEV